MKFKRHILKLSILAGVLACVLIASTLFASGTTAGTSSNNLNLIVTTTSDEVKSGETFDVVVKVSNTNIASFKLAGLEVTLNYDGTKISTNNNDVTRNLNEDESTAVHNVVDNKVKFVCVKNEFTNEAGYTELSGLFTVTFTAKTNIANPSLLFDKNDIEFLMGDVDAFPLEHQDAIYAGDMEALANAILDKGLELVTDANAGIVVVAPTPVAEGTAASGNINGTTVQYKTGSEITVGGKTAKVVVKGDLDGDGVVTVFDATINKNGNLDALREYAGDLGASDDVQHTLDYIVGREANITK